MTIAITTTKSQWNGNGATTEFAFEFKVEATGLDYLKVVLTDPYDVDVALTRDTHYEVDDETLTDSGGTITMLDLTAVCAAVILPAGWRITLYRQVDIVQETDLQNQSAFYAETIEDALDYQTMINQQQQEELERCVKIPITSTDTADAIIANLLAATSAAAASAGAASASASSAADAVVDAEAAVSDAEDQATAAAASALAAAQSAANSGLPIITAGDKGKAVLVNDTETGFILGAGGLAWGIVSTGTNAAKGNGYLVNASAGNVTVTLPAAPTVGDMVGIGDFYGAALSYTVKLARNGKNIQGAAADWTATSANEAIVVVYADATRGWVITERYAGTTVVSAVATGTVAPFVGTTAPSGWAMLTGASAVRTLGDASSGASLASTTASALFTLLWDSMADGQAPVSSGRGASAAADFAAHKTITIPDPRGRTLIGAGSGSGLTARTHGATGGAETHQLSEAELASHAHQQSAYACAISAYACLTQGGSGYYTGYAGSNSAHANMQPWMATHLIIKL